MEEIPNWMIWTYAITTVIMLVFAIATIYKFRKDTPEWKKQPEDKWYLTAFVVISIVPGVNTVIGLLFLGLHIHEEWL